MAIITDDRKVIWEGNVGIVGGIPNRTTIFTTISAGASAATVQSALNSCPTNQVVLLSAGSYSWGSTDIDWSSVADGVVLRGAGPSSTTITVSTGQILFRAGVFAEAALSVDANLSADATKGDTVLTLTSVPSWVTVGDLIGIDQLNDSSFVADAGTEGGSSYRDLLGNGDRGLGQINKVTAKTATTITVETPLYYGFKTAQTAQIFQPGYDPSATNPLSGCGIEDLKISATTTSSGTHLIKVENANGCWFKNLELDNTAGGAHVQAAFSYRCEIRHCYIHDSHTQASGQGYGVALYHISCGWLIEDNIFRLLHNPMSAQYGSAGNAFTYNYEADGESDSGQNPGMNTHGVHAFMNLWEGNYCEDKVLADWTHGSSSHQTIFRNRVTGDNTNANNDSRCCVSVEYYNRYWNIVGNILGVNGAQNKYIAHSSSTSDGSQGTIIKVGGEVNINLDFSPSDANSYTSGSFILIHGNWDYVQDQQTWDGNVADQTLINSYIYSSKPSIFGILSWPPYDPANPGSASVDDIPAGYRFINGQDPPADTSSPQKIKIFNIRNIIGVREISVN